MRKYILFLLCYLFVLDTTAQSHIGFNKLFRYSGDTVRRADGINAIVFDSTENSLYFTTSGFGQSSARISSVFYKTDLYGNLLSEVLDTFPGGSVYYHALTESSDHHFLYWGGAAYITSPSIQSQWILTKTDKNLNIIWKKSYDVETTDAFTLTIKNLPDSGNIILLCNKFTPQNNLGYPYQTARTYLRKMDSSGNLLEQSTPGPNPANNHNGQALEVTNDGGYLINGRTFGWGQNSGGAYSLKADQNGNELWHQLYGQDYHTAWLNDMIKTKGNLEQYYNVGQVSPDNNMTFAFINKIDAQGNEIWHKTISKGGNSDCFFGGVNTPEDGCIAVGSAYLSDENAARGWIVKLDQSGEKKWSKLYTREHPKSLHDYIYYVVDLPDGSFVAAGFSFGQNENGLWTQDGWLLRVDSDGCSTPNCSGDLAINEVPSGNISLDIYPNHSSGVVFLEGHSAFASQTNVSLLDNLGRTVKTLPSPSSKTKMQYDLGGMTPGVYYLKIEGKGQSVQKKITIIP